MPISIKQTLGAVGMAGLLMVSGAVLADFEAGVRAYDSGNYRAAMMEFTQEANQGHVQAQRRLGEMYRTGQGASVKWLTLAYVNGERDLAPTLEMIRESLSESDVVRGEQLALEWLEDANRVVFADDDTDSLYEQF